MRKPLKFFIVIITALLMILSGCSFGPKTQPSAKQGALRVVIALPESKEVSKGGISDLVLDKVTATLTRSGYTPVVNNATISGNTAQLDFNVDIGEWNIAVIVKDKSGYDVYQGNGVANVTATPSTKQIALSPKPGDVDIMVQIPPGMGITKGDVTLRDPSDPSGQRNGTLNMSTGHVVFTGLTPTTWYLKLRLYNASNAVVFEDEKPIDVLPGRSTPYTVGVNASTGQLVLSVDWDKEPSVPTGLAAAAVASGVKLTWNINPESNIAGYAIYRACSGGKMIMISDSLYTGTSFIDSSADTSRPYTYWIQAYNQKHLSSKLSAGVNYVPSMSGGTVILQHDGENAGGLGSKSAGFIAAFVRFKPEEFAAYTNPALTSIKIFINESKNYDAFLLGGVTTAPGQIEFDLGLQDVPLKPGWNTINLPAPYAIENDLWLGYEIELNSPAYPIGMDAGPPIPETNYIGTSDGLVDILELSSDCGNFNIRAVITYGGSKGRSVELKPFVRREYKVLNNAPSANILSKLTTSR